MTSFSIATIRMVALGSLLAATALAAACSSGSNPVAPSSSTGSGTATSPGGSGTTPGTSTPPTTATPAPLTARYRLAFDALWSAEIHPQDFPSDAHFSPLVGGTHNSTVRFWREGVTATDGIRDMAERGRTTPLDTEVRAAIAAGSAQNLLLGGDIRRSPGMVTLEFEVSQSHSLVTLVSMVAPSPDWFTGVSGLPLFENEQWVERRMVEVGPWDAGTDSGVTFSSPDQATTPPQPVARITGFPFLQGGQVAPIARLTFERIQ